jgi:hypothetical protein
MRIIRGSGDTIKFENVAVGDPFYYAKVLYMRLDDGWKGGAGVSCPGAVNLEAGSIRVFEYETQVTPAKVDVVVQEVGRVACGYNPK